MQKCNWFYITRRVQFSQQKNFPLDPGWACPSPRTLLHKSQFVSGGSSISGHPGSDESIAPRVWMISIGMTLERERFMFNSMVLEREGLSLFCSSWLSTSISVLYIGSVSTPVSTSGVVMICALTIPKHSSKCTWMQICFDLIYLLVAAIVLQSLEQHRTVSSMAVSNCIVVETWTAIGKFSPHFLCNCISLAFVVSSHG